MNWNERLLRLVAEQLDDFPVEQRSMFVPWLQTEVGFQLYEVNMVNNGIYLDDVRAEVLFNNILAEVVKTTEKSAEEYVQWLCNKYQISDEELRMLEKRGLLVRDFENEQDLM